MVRFVPELGIEVPEQCPGLRLPSPPEVEEDFAERLEFGRQFRNDVE
jgi:hypothetical protein